MRCGPSQSATASHYLLFSWADMYECPRQSCVCDFTGRSVLVALLPQILDLADKRYRPCGSCPSPGCHPFAWFSSNSAALARILPRLVGRLFYEEVVRDGFLSVFPRKFKWFVMNTIMLISEVTSCLLLCFCCSCVRSRVRIVSRDLDSLSCFYEMPRPSVRYKLSLTLELSSAVFLAGLSVADFRGAGVSVNSSGCSATSKPGEMLRSMLWAVFSGLLVYDLIVIIPDTIRQMWNLSFCFVQVAGGRNPEPPSFGLASFSASSALPNVSIFECLGNYACDVSMWNHDHTQWMGGYINVRS